MKSQIKRKLRKFIAKSSFLSPIDKRLTRKSLVKEYYYIRLLSDNNDDQKESIEVVNLNATDVCNSGCTMCNIWKQDGVNELTPDGFGSILTDSLFDNLKHVGVTGGEPTLRADLKDIFSSIIKSKPDIQGLSLITNCIRQSDVIDRVSEVKAVCTSNNVPFSMMVSLDGVGDKHDEVRGKKGNFESAINVYNHFKGLGVEIATGTTISKINVWDVDELLFYMRKHGMYGRFRVAEFIKRLYNDDRNEVIRNFDEDESYHLILFFYKLIFEFEQDEYFQRTYYSIINVLSGGERLIGCPYQTNGVVLNSKGEIAYCAPKSKIIGDASKQSARALYNDNIDERTRIMDDHCKSCIHDYHHIITGKEIRLKNTHEFWRKFVSIDGEKRFCFESEVTAIRLSDSSRQIFITGWYGTETVGDKAILGGIIEDLYQEYGTEIGIVVSSLYPHITKRTLQELKIQATIVDTYSEDFVAYTKGSDLVVMGGGPLMDLEELSLPLVAFKLAKSVGARTKIYGCGIGPLFNEKYIQTVKQILNLSDEILLRDNKSVDIARNWTKGNKNIALSGDYAKKYLERYKAIAYPKAQTKIMSCYLRELTHEYFGNLSELDFEQLKKAFEKNLSLYILEKARELGIETIRFEHMHNFVVGGDDRDFSRYFIENYFADSPVQVEYNKKLSTVDSIVECMKTSTVNICMRFHSVLFAETLHTEFIALDYTAGGKIYNYLNDHSKLDKLLTVEQLIGVEE
jgi:polysaccharide pyruvyl transferase WcaK-like protein/MoaA/NifB/PqqE/SkfB family radical SAM enzyme